MSEKMWLKPGTLEARAAGCVCPDILGMPIVMCYCEYHADMPLCWQDNWEAMEGKQAGNPEEVVK